MLSSEFFKSTLLFYWILVHSPPPPIIKTILGFKTTLQASSYRHLVPAFSVKANNEIQLPLSLYKDPNTHQTSKNWIYFYGLNHLNVIWDRIKWQTFLTLLNRNRTVLGPGPRGWVLARIIPSIQQKTGPAPKPHSVVMQILRKSDQSFQRQPVTAIPLSSPGKGRIFEGPRGPKAKSCPTFILISPQVRSHRCGLTGSSFWLLCRQS